MRHYDLYELEDESSNGVQQALSGLRESVIPRLEERGDALWGIFFGLFGLGTNELYLVTANDRAPASARPDFGEITLKQHRAFVPTARPKTFTPPDKPGIYVFRWFDVHNRDVDEIAAMSEQAWVSFEDGFDSEIQGLFAEADRSSATGKMLLVTWYRDLSVWEASRSPSEEARAIFMRRHQLTIKARPVATRLVTPVRS